MMIIRTIIVIMIHVRLVSRLQVGFTKSSNIRKFSWKNCDRCAFTSLSSTLPRANLIVHL